MEFNGKTLSALAMFGSDEAVRYTAQELTEEQKARARQNIGAAAEKSASAKLIFNKELTNFTYSDEMGAFAATVSPASFAMSVGENYQVVWDGETYDLQAQDTGHIIAGTVSVGNLRGYGLEGNNEPFVIVSMQGGAMFFAGTDTEPTAHTVAIYHKQSAPELPAVGATDNDKILQVVNGAWAAVAVADSSIATFVDNYINDALGGDY